MRRLGILGGTFDPIHHAHLVAAEEACYQLGLGLVLFMPAGAPPHKPGHPVSAAHHRLRMIELAIAGQPHFAISGMDLNRPGPSYTVEALHLLRREWGPTPIFFFIEGADSLAELSNWYRPERLIELAEIAVVDRPGVQVDLVDLEQRLPGLSARLHWVRMPLLDISASDIRARVRDGRPISYLVPAAVEAYIVEHGLYKE
ncbi:MAG: nicotinate-nucleotide adenylyltransferase [Anaerolineae bacterium]|nr:nicotinate-nucleotide adenylyltransferase [Anaerolineae bacterium]